MARPRKSESDKRDERCEQRYTLAEIELVRQQAARAGLNSSEFIRRRALSQPVRAASNGNASPALISELNRIGVNVNQLARAHHRGSAFTDQWEQIGEQLSALLSDVAAEHGS